MTDLTRRLTEIMDILENKLDVDPNYAEQAFTITGIDTAARAIMALDMTRERLVDLVVAAIMKHAGSLSGKPCIGGFLIADAAGDAADAILAEIPAGWRPIASVPSTGEKIWVLRHDGIETTLYANLEWVETEARRHYTHWRPFHRAQERPEPQAAGPGWNEAIDVIVAALSVGAAVESSHKQTLMDAIDEIRALRRPNAALPPPSRACCQ